MKTSQLEKPRRKSGGVIIPYPKDKWSAIRHSYFEEGVWKVIELARLHSVSIRAIQARMSREKWPQKLKEKFAMGEVQDALSRKDDLKSLEELMVSKKEQTDRWMIEGTTELLDKVTKRIKLLNPRDGGEIAAMTGALKNLQGMLENLMGEVRGVVKKPQIDVNILKRAVEEADKHNAMEEELRKKFPEASPAEISALAGPIQIT